MGQEIAETRFKHFDFQRYERLFAHEMEILREWFHSGRMSDKRSIAGLELEAWLVDAAGQPTPWNQQVISLAGSPDIVPELSRFNVEFNVAPRSLGGRGLAELAEELQRTWRQCEAAANQLGSSVLAIGILPTITDSLLSLANMSNLHRYRALNEQVLRQRQGRPIRLNLCGRESLASEHRDVMLESAATSFQLHLQVPARESVRYYNASLVVSAPLVAATANSPALFGSLLWEETRIPLFEQSVDIGGGALPRVTFGADYAHESLLEVFCENAEQYPVLLPLAMDQPSERLAHVRLLNGTIWRWNRPLLGFDDDGTPHLRIEQRVMPAGPTLADMAANMAFYYGLAENLAHESPAPEAQLSFEAARDNFYRAARDGLECNIQWLGGESRPLRDLVSAELLPRAADGLERLGVAIDLATHWLRIIAERVETAQTGATWQRAFLERNGRDLPALTRAYRELQLEGRPVHEWPLHHLPTQSSARINRSMLRIVHELPVGLLTASAAELQKLLGQPTLIHLPGRRAEPLFVSILLHGNEDVGLHAVQACLRELQSHPLPRALSIFVGNVAAAQRGVRFLPDQPDYNRVWPGSDRRDSPEHALLEHVVDEMRSRRVFAAVDLHSNTGWNPHYACVTSLGLEHLQLAALFGRTAVYFVRPRGVQTMAFADLCPAVTCECGKVHDASGVRHAAEFLSACLHLAEVPRHPLAEGDLHLFHTVATMYVPSRLRFSFAQSAVLGDLEAFDLILRNDLERLNFQELAAGDWLGWSRRQSPLPLTVMDESGRDVTTDFLVQRAGQLEIRRPVIPAMLTQDEAIIRQDCLGYLMERLEVPYGARG